MPLRLKVNAIAFFERPLVFARPFRFGAVTITASTQLFVRVEIEVEGKGRATGASAEMLAPKWFDKRPHLTEAQSLDGLRRSLAVARELYLTNRTFETAFALHTACIGPQVATCAAQDIPPLAASFGPAEIDKAILDALLRVAGANFFDGMTGNIAGIDARLTPDLDDAAIARFLSTRKRIDRVAVRHTVGMDDKVEGEGGVADAGENAGARYFKLKLNGDPAHDAARLARIGSELARLPYATKVTLDANEQYADLAALSALVDRLDHDAALEPIAANLLYIEQPMPRDITKASPLEGLAARNFIIDEADDCYDAFPQARALGYRGISSKSCKGIYKSIINATRAAAWSADSRYFISGEDLTCQAGLGVQQDLALGALIGVTHAERNGHHYVDGFAETPADEADAFLIAHPDLYTRAGGKVRLAIHDGDLLTGSIAAAPGFASSIHPDWSTMQPLRRPTPRVS
ncbi:MULTISPECIES: hypothetical protein [unclassified Bradyrhizobium]|uniref:hypothetical protein n=1 Tax=unclassified Bradyrhizobium TaxID=2631580 RepID=UPI001BABAA04|nr:MULTISPECIES: hypothetical protein [unclassified Bradyrhizobium]MBR1202089.1 hypothetical protein [Bradyrhizobium sp. AUGA SZCCT0124]MBR1311342.1 hypothetical protein [Bradyrhizobium sp. AUGA SZCCT0051]MBR1339038.1 hypothetical protein [Bradyrhizobium sp. AUGA SZCCT0105]MBR1353612.1 hypothetical protein [Bradyrhizobium sp. AUGA SZCCT0045]